MKVSYFYYHLLDCKFHISVIILGYILHCIELFYSNTCICVNIHVNIFSVDIYPSLCCPIEDSIFVFLGSVV